MAMKSDATALFREIQRSAQKGMRVIETILPKVADDPFSLYLNGKELQYSQINDRARQEMLKEQRESYRTGAVAELALKGSVHADTLFDTSISHMARLMIRESSRELTDMWRALNHHENAGEQSRQLAEEFLDFEQKTITELKKFL